MTNILRFNPNPVTDPLLNNRSLIKEELISCYKEVREINLEEVQNLSTKLQFSLPNGKKSFYEGNIISVPLLVRLGCFSEDEAKVMKWEEGEEERIYRHYYDKMSFLKSWIEENNSDITSVVFFVAQPKSFIRHHYGVPESYKNFRLHLCLQEDLGCVFDLENERYVWREGELIGFDDSMVYHGIKHDGTRPRIILSIDIAKSKMEQYALPYNKREFVPLDLRKKSLPKILNW